MIYYIIILCLFLLSQILVSFMSLSDNNLIDDFLKWIQFKDSKNGRIAGLIFFNFVPLIPLIYFSIRVLIKHMIYLYPHIKEAIEGENK